MDILPHKTAPSRHKSISRAGLPVPARLLERLGPGKRIDALMPGPGSNRGCRASAIFHTFMLMLHEGGKCLDDVRHLRKEPALMKLPGFRSVPCSSTLGNWLRKVGQHKGLRNALVEINRHLPKVALGLRDRVTLDIDASAIHAKKTARRTYQGRRGYMPMFGHIAETGQLAHCELRRGNVPPAARNLEFFDDCREVLPAGVRVDKFRADAASYQASIINRCREHDIRFAIRAKTDKAVKAAIAQIPDWAWRPVVKDGEGCRGEWLARTLHVMGETPQAFCLVVQRAEKRCRDEDAPQPEQVEMPMADQPLCELDGETAFDGRYLYRAIATDLDEEGFSDDEIVWWHNRRADASENRIKELRSDFGGAHLPCSGFRANAVYLYLNAIACNLLVLMRRTLPLAWYGKRADTFRHRLNAIAGRLVRHGRQWTLKTDAVDLKVLGDAPLQGTLIPWHLDPNPAPRTSARGGVRAQSMAPPESGRTRPAGTGKPGTRRISNPTLWAILTDPAARLDKSGPSTNRNRPKHLYMSIREGRSLWNCSTTHDKI